MTARYWFKPKRYGYGATPVTWEEVEQCMRKRDPELLVFLSEQVLERVAKNDDLFEPVLTLKQQLPKPKDLSPELSEQFERYVPKVKPAKEGKQPRRTTTKTR